MQKQKTKAKKKKNLEILTVGLICEEDDIFCQCFP